ncbi:hypothetical protein AVEN_215674-1 [Araneus ventricosus]|uniref:Integrase catalytic domain-containing protein n=1 Tax=Araneus ventricosus TaxID=182803 RepID=A0A4Y2MAN4_ARAVE|nr:hypothetical protein AVEN_215674-1 [Araneus ventricosus]
MPDMKVETCVETFLNGWLSSFGVPEVVTKDRGSQFELELFQAFTKFLGSQRILTTSYHPAWRKCFIALLKDAFRCHCLSTPRWMSVLALVMLGIPASLKENLCVSSAEFL